jgi:hypothetical protein
MERETIWADMENDPREGRSQRRSATTCIATVLAATCMTVTACGGAKSTPAVRLALTAPTDGAAVSVSKLKVFGSVHPASAAVAVAGHRVRVSNGAFARWMTLHKGVSHIKVVATAAGFVPAKLDIAVRSSPRPSPRSASGETPAEVAVRAGA